MSSSLEIWRYNYCDSEYERCVRYQLTMGGKAVAPNLLPNGKLL